MSRGYSELFNNSWVTIGYNRKSLLSVKIVYDELLSAAVHDLIKREAACDNLKCWSAVKGSPRII